MPSSTNIIDLIPTDQAVLVNNAVISRPIDLTPDWTALKVGVRFLISGSANKTPGISGSARFCIGFSSGSTLGSATPDFTMGFRTNTVLWGLFSSSANTREYYSHAIGQFRVIQGGNAVSTSGDVITNFCRWDKVCGVLKPNIFTMYVTKNPLTPNVYVLQSEYSSTVGAFEGIDSQSFYYSMQTSSVVSLSGSISGSSESAIYAFSASKRIEFDRAYFGWNKGEDMGSPGSSGSIVLFDFAVSTFP